MVCIIGMFARHTGEGGLIGSVLLVDTTDIPARETIKPYGPKDWQWWALLPLLCLAFIAGFLFQTAANCVRFCRWLFNRR
jgi:hypothetical protein